MSDAPFSLQELTAAGRNGLVDVASVAASDDVTLTYRPYLPETPSASVIFYHGGGAHSGADYHHLGNGLRDAFNLAVYMPDLRGHGASGGARGDAPSPQQVWRDITTMIRHVRTQHPILPLILGGHSSGAAMTLNYASWEDRDRVEAWVLLSPELGFRAQTARTNNPTPFANVRVAPFVVSGLTGGRLCGHSKAVRFNYPAEVLHGDPGMVGYYTVNMANAVTPSAPRTQFSTLDRPLGLWIGADDELLVPERVLAFADLATHIRADSHAAIVQGAKHGSILLTAHEVIGPWITKVVQDVISKARPA